jgi:5-methylcytosine-specific restriction protein A
MLAKHPFCVVCEQAGVTQLAQELDHRVPLSQGGARLDPANLQPLCRVCHARKTANENETARPFRSRV